MIFIRKFNKKIPYQKLDFDRELNYNSVRIEKNLNFQFHFVVFH